MDYGCNECINANMHECDTMIKLCPSCGSMEVDELPNGSWLLENAPLPHYVCKDCRTVFSTGENKSKL